MQVPNLEHFRSQRLIFPLGALAAAVFLGAPSPCRALPSFARQMDMQCIACHTEFPILTEFGRQFKLNGYTMSTEQTRMPPFAFMLQPSFTRTEADQVGGAAPGFGPNDNYATTQASIFYAGRLFGPYASDILSPGAAAIANRFGIFSQATYDGVAKIWAWDNTEIRYADHGTFGQQSAVWGVYLNNNPTLQDPWNTAPAWGFPFTGSGLAQTPAASTLIEGALAGQVAGLGAYTMVANSVYVDAGVYRSLGPGFQSSVGVDPTGEAEISGVAPYWRVAVEKQFGASTWEFGTFGLAADTYPARVSTAGSDRTVDAGIDSQYQVSFKQSDISAFVSLIHENESWSASQALGSTTNASDNLWSFKATGDYLFDKTIGGAVQYFVVNGGGDPLLYGGSASGSPDSDGFIFQANYLPFNKGGGPAFWPRSNVKLTVQYVVYDRFNGAAKNYDGAGSNADGNDTLYLEAWVVF
jgi:hypothetical protein